MKWFEISSGNKDPKFLLHNFPDVLHFLKQHCFLFDENSKINESDSTWFTQNKLYYLKEKVQILAVMRETIPYSTKTLFVQHELATEKMTSINEQKKFILLFQKKILTNLPNMCKQSIFLTFHPIEELEKTKLIDSFELLFDKQIRSILPIIRTESSENKKHISNNVIYDNNYEIEILDSPLNNHDYKIFKKLSDSATNEANSHIKNELLKNYFLIAESEKDDYQDYIKNWEPGSKSILSIIKKSKLIIGYTHIIRHAFIENMAFQSMTYINPVHRGLGLSKILKKNTYEFLLENEHWDDINMIMTNNHSNNAPMLKVNDQLGFKRVVFFFGWLFDLKN